MKAINLLSIISAKKDLSENVFQNYLDNFGIHFKSNEINDLNLLVSDLKKCNSKSNIFDLFYFGFIIPQIGKEFDLLRFGTNYAINIEIKTQDTGIRIQKQLIQNKYYLSFLNKLIYNFTYISEESKLLFLTNTDEVKNVTFNFLIDLLENQETEHVDNIFNLFNPSNYLVSPFNSTEAFINGNYFLTDQQEKFKKQIFKKSKTSEPRFFSIEGAAGTGKTLLAYDIVKEFINRGKKVVVIHCGKLNQGHFKLRNKYFWNIISAKQIENNSFDDFDLILLDETQRIYKSQIKELLDKIKKNTTYIFSYDSNQCLAAWEINNNIPQFIFDRVSPIMLKLTEKIRTNKEIASFIKNLFDLSKTNTKQIYQNIFIQYFDSDKDAKDYIMKLHYSDWKIINFTPSQYDKYPYDSYHKDGEDTTHDVIGQEFDNVAVIIDSYFYYKSDGILSTKGWRNNPYYHPTKMLFQNMTRTRKKLYLIIVRNSDILRKCLNILNGNK